MPRAGMLAIDVIAITIMVFGLYFPRHRRKDLVVALLVVNIGVLAVADALASTGINAGLGLGLFGVLSIIRLRSSELAQEEVAYYFCALALGLLAGLSVDATWLTPAIMAALLIVMYIGDHPALFNGYRVQVVTVPLAFADEHELTRHLEGLLGGSVHQTKVRKIDFVNDRTTVEVRYRLADRHDSPTTMSAASLSPTH